MFPKFLLGDNTDQPDEIYIIHTEFPRFIYNPESEELDMFDDVDTESEEEEVTTEVAKLLEEALSFYEREIDRYDQLEEEDDAQNENKEEKA
ncbi:MAG: hypothetical protein LAT76_09475 [Schleiferiaceae bacterium]|nr:hypothetical protein [Schleiferiaceae bacterium]